MFLKGLSASRSVLNVISSCYGITLFLQGALQGYDWLFPFI